MNGSQRGSVASQHLELWPGSWYDNELCRLLFMHHVTRKIPRAGGHAGSPWLVTAVCAHPDTTWHDSTAHLFPLKQRAASASAALRPPTLSQWCSKSKWKMKCIFLCLSSPSQRLMLHTWLTPRRKMCGSDTETPCISHLYYTATHFLRGVFFSSWSRKDEYRQCLPSWKCIPLGNPQHETNKHPPHDTLAIHSHLHGYVECCQDSLSVQC